MPYIDQKSRKKFSKELKTLGEHITTVGELNYCITRLALAYLKRFGLSYRTINDIMGVLECSKEEFYFRVAKPYEAKKRKFNGDVFR
jgi:hypothetical protein